MRSSADALGVQLIVTRVHNEAEVEQVVTSIAEGGEGGLIFPSDPFSMVHRQRIVDMAAQRAVPAVYPFRQFAHSGGLISYGVDLIAQYREAAAYIDRIFRGEKVADLPVQMPTKFELVINFAAAKLLGLTVPPALLAQADEV